MDIWMLGWLVDRRNSGEIGDLTPKYLRVKTLRITPLTFFKRSIDEHFNELPGAQQFPRHLSFGTKGRDETHNDDQTSVDHQGRDLSHPPYIFNSL